MRITIRSRNLAPKEPVRAHIARRIDFSLGRFDEHVSEVTVRLADLNGPRGGVDKACQLEVRLGGGQGTVRIEETDAELLAAVDRAADRAGVAVARTLEKAKPQRTRASTATVRRSA